MRRIGERVRGSFGSGCNEGACCGVSSKNRMSCLLMMVAGEFSLSGRGRSMIEETGDQAIAWLRKMVVRMRTSEGWTGR